MFKIGNRTGLAHAIFGAALGLAAGLALPPSALAQTAQAGTPVPAFEVVSVKPLGSTALTSGGSRTLRGLRVVGTSLICDLPLRAIIASAYSLKYGIQVVAPGWLDSELYTIEARLPEGTDRKTAMLMLQTTLAERFAFQCHREQREFPGYALTVGKGGFRLHEVPKADRTSSKMSASASPLGTTKRFTAQAMRFQQFSEWLMGGAGGPVLDLTGIQGAYDFDITWTQDRRDEIGGGQQADPALLAAVESQLGLKFEKRKIPLDVLVVDHVEKTPTPN